MLPSRIFACAVASGSASYSRVAIGPRTTVQNPLRWSENPDWKLDFSNIERLSPEVIARRRAEFDRNKEIAKGQRVVAGVATMGFGLIDDWLGPKKVIMISLVSLVLTLQFIRPLHREKLVRDIVDGLNENGCLILVEKVLGEDSLFNRQFIKYYYDYKARVGYSELEIRQKREALENVLIPYKLLENRELLLRSGFRYVDTFFKWYNFCGMVAVK